MTRVYGDEVWRLALAGEAEALRRAEQLVDGYDAARARAFALAIDGLASEATAALAAGRTEDWPFAAAYAADVARVRFLAGDDAQAVEALADAVRGADRVDRSLSALLAECVRRGRGLRRRALRVAVSGGTPWQRLRAAAGVLAARR